MEDSICPKCKVPAILGSSQLFYLYPDDEPYESGKYEKIDPFEIDLTVNIYYCPKCACVVSYWFEPEFLAAGKTEKSECGTCKYYGGMKVHCKAPAMTACPDKE